MIVLSWGGGAQNCNPYSTLAHTTALYSQVAGFVPSPTICNWLQLLTPQIGRTVSLSHETSHRDTGRKTRVRATGQQSVPDKGASLCPSFFDQTGALLRCYYLLYPQSSTTLSARARTRDSASASDAPCNVMDFGAGTGSTLHATLAAGLGATLGATLAPTLGATLAKLPSYPQAPQRSLCTTVSNPTVSMTNRANSACG